jgi:hypothetical protein
MSDGFFKWYRSPSTEGDFYRQIELLGRRSIVIEHPAFHTGIVLDVDGNDVRSSVAEIARTVSRGVGPINVEWWLSSDVDLTCCYNWPAVDCEVQTYYLDGLSKAQVDTVKSVLTDCSESPEFDTLGYILDTRGRSADFNWDGFFLDGGRQLVALPDVMAFGEEILQGVNGIPDSFTVSTISDDLVRVSRSVWQ